MAELSNVAQGLDIHSLQSMQLDAVVDQTKPVAVTNLEGSILYISPALVGLLQTVLPSLGHPHLAKNFPDDAQNALELMATLARWSGQQSATIDLGSQQQFSVSVSIISDALALWQFERAEPGVALDIPDSEWHALLSAMALTIHGLERVDATAEAIVTAAVPQIADWCTIDLLDSRDLFLRRAAIRHVDAEQASRARRMRRRFPVSHAGNHPVMGVVTRGEPVLIEAFTDEKIRQIARGEEHYRFISSLGLRSSMILPVEVDGSILGAITFASSASGRSYRDADLERAAEFARHAALAIRNTQRFQLADEVSRIREHYLSVASHEIRTPLAVVSGFAALLFRHFEQVSPDPDRIKALLTELQQGVERLESLTEDLLVASSVHQGSSSLNFEECDLVELASEVIRRQLVATPELKGKILLDGDTSVVGRWEPGLLDRALSNLIGNAIKYSPDHVNVRVTVSTDSGVGAIFRIADTGIGMNSNDLETLFMPFIRGNAARKMSDGTGLGLYITSQIVSQHGGSIDVESEEGHGTTFTVMLPIQTRAS